MKRIFCSCGMLEKDCNQMRKEIGEKCCPNCLHEQSKKKNHKERQNREPDPEQMEKDAMEYMETIY